MMIGWCRICGYEARGTWVSTTSHTNQLWFLMYIYMIANECNPITKIWRNSDHKVKVVHNFHIDVVHKSNHTDRHNIDHKF